MHRLLPSFLRGMLAALLLAANTLFWCIPLFAVALAKLVLPPGPARAATDRLLNAIAHRWIAWNSGWMGLTQATRWDVGGLDSLEPEGWYMVAANHQSWADIFVLQHLLNRRIPLLKFVLKQQLIYVPVIGLAWWALDFPFMRRHSRAYLERHPEKRLEDLETTRRACEKFSLVPTSVMNFVEGTRFTAHKQQAQQSPYRHLLKPKAGALAQALSVLGDRFRSFVDITIVYPQGAPSFWQFLCGEVAEVVVRVRLRPIAPEFRAGDYAADPQFRKSIEQWLQALWREKDSEIAALLETRRTRER
jgi:1-acyl-sn-glycerol-3-phosphate acyltransferase